MHIKTPYSYNLQHVFNLHTHVTYADPYTTYYSYAANAARRETNGAGTGLPMELVRALMRWLSGSPPTQLSGVAAFLSQQRDATPAVLPNAPTYGHQQIVSQLPAHVVARSGQRRVCAAYRVSCVRGARPMRASLSLASGEGGLGLGHPVPSANGHPVWRLRPTDFCKPPPPELGRLPRQVGRGSRVPGPEDCFCPTNSLLPRFQDPKGFGRLVPANSLPGVPKIIRTWSSCKNESYITYQCSELPLLPPQLPSGTPVTVAEAAVRGGIDIYVATSDHSGHSTCHTNCVRSAY